jgi:hypothetical protein
VKRKGQPFLGSNQVAETLPADDERARPLESVANRWLGSAPGMRPSIAAAVLGLSEPTAMSPGRLFRASHSTGSRLEVTTVAAARCRSRMIS